MSGICPYCVFCGVFTSLPAAGGLPPEGAGATGVAGADSDTGERGCRVGKVVPQKKYKKPMVANTPTKNPTIKPLRFKAILLAWRRHCSGQ